MKIHLTFLRYSRGTPCIKQTHFYGKFLEADISCQDKTQKTMFYKFERYDFTISEVSHYEFRRGYSSIS
jgi:hypothetical protein